MVNEAYAIDKKHWNTLWWDGIQKEMDKTKITFQTIPKSKKPPNEFQYINCYIVFYINLDDFQRKACQVVGGHMTHIPDTITYSSVVTRETVWITLTMAALHDLEVKAA